VTCLGLGPAARMFAVETSCVASISSMRRVAANGAEIHVGLQEMNISPLLSILINECSWRRCVRMVWHSTKIMGVRERDC
jgi:hypothetical protein